MPITFSNTNGTGNFTLVNNTNSGNIVLLKTPPPPPTYTIGQSVLGGVIGYILQPGDAGYDANTQHGLVVAPTDQSTAMEWGCQGTSIPAATQSAIGKGAANTSAILSGCATRPIAASICGGGTTINGYSDWYLPSKNELHALYLNIGPASILGNVGNFLTNGAYWSSTEDSLFGAWAHYFFADLQDFILKSSANGMRVRAVRSF